MSIGNRITDLRKQKNLSQMQLAELLDVSRQAVSKWENDQSAPDTIKLIQLADVLDADLEYLASGRVRTPEVVTVEKIVERTVPVTVEKTVEVEKLVPVERIVEVEKIIEVERPMEIEKIVQVEVPVVVEKIVETVVEVEKPVIRKVHRTKYIRNPVEFAVVGVVCLLIGVLIGFFL